MTTDPMNDRRGEPDVFAAKLRAVLDGWASLHPPPRVTVAFSGGLDSTVLLADALPPRACRRASAPRTSITACTRARRSGARIARPSPRRWRRVRRRPRRRRSSVGRGPRGGCARGALSRARRAAAARRMAADGASRRRSARDAAAALAARHGRPRPARHHRVRAVRRRLARPAAARRSRARSCAPKRSRGKLAWLDDPSNARAAPRSQLPAPATCCRRCVARWPAAAQHAERLAEQTSDAERLLEAVAAEDARALAAPWHVPRAALAALEPARQRNLLRYLLRAVGPRRAERAQGRGAARGVARIARRVARARALAERRRPRISRGAVPVAPLPPRLAAATTRRASACGDDLDRPRRSRRARAGARRPTACPQSWLERGLDAALSRRRRAISSARPRPPSLAEASCSRRAASCRGCASRVPLLYRGDELAAIGDLWISADVDAAPASEPRWRVQWTRASARACTGTALAASRASRGWWGRGTFGTLQYRLDVPSTQLRWPDDGFPWEGRPVLPVLT